MKGRLLAERRRPQKTRNRSTALSETWQNSQQRWDEQYLEQEMMAAPGSVERDFYLVTGGGETDGRKEPNEATEGAEPNHRSDL